MSKQWKTCRVRISTLERIVKLSPEMTGYDDGIGIVLDEVEISRQKRIVHSEKVIVPQEVPKPIPEVISKIDEAQLNFQKYLKHIGTDFKNLTEGEKDRCIGRFLKLTDEEERGVGITWLPR